MQNNHNQHEASQEKNTLEAQGQSSNYLLVRQPEKSKGMQELLTVLSDLERISEVVSEDRSQDMGSGGAMPASGTATSGASAQTTARDQAIASLPTVAVMRSKLTAHLQKEVKHLERKAKRVARSTKAGSAYLLNETYARIRKIQRLIAEILDAAAEVVKRLYVRLFIDHQQLV